MHITRSCVQTALVFLALTMCQLALAAPTAAQRAEAKKSYQRGVTEFKLGHFADAAQAYEEAYRVLPDPALLFNAAQAHRLGGHKEQALSLYKSYLRDYGVEGGNGAEVEAQIVALNTAIAADHAKAADEEQRQRAVAEREGATRLAAQEAAAAQARAEAARLSTPPPKPIYKRGWFWGAIVGGVAAVGLGVGLGVGLTRSSSFPTASYGSIQAN